MPTIHIVDSSSARTGWRMVYTEQRQPGWPDDDPALQGVIDAPASVPTGGLENYLPSYAPGLLLVMGETARDREWA